MRPERTLIPAPTTDSRRHTPWLPVARLAWIALALLTVGLFGASIPARFDQLATVATSGDTRAGQLTPADASTLAEVGLSAAAYATYIVVVEVIPALLAGTIVLLMVWRKSDDWMVLLVSLSILLLLASLTPIMGAPLAGALPLWRMAVTVLQALGLAGFNLLFWLFPDGRFVPRWTRWLLVVSAVYLVIWPLFPEVRRQAMPLTAATRTDFFLLCVMLVWLLLGVSAQVYRYRYVSSLVERQQTKWVVFGFALLLLLLALAILPLALVPALTRPGLAALLYRVAGITVLLFGFSLIPLTFAIAILRYRLWDIDILIHRTLVYGGLTALLALFYFSSVVLLQWLFRVLTGRGDDLAIIISTLGIAALFNPLRARIQGFIDRRFYRRKYDAEQVLATFANTLRAEVDLDRLTGSLLAVVEETMQPAHVSLWLRTVPPGSLGSQAEAGRE